jgi:hypothetical protein
VSALDRPLAWWAALAAMSAMLMIPIFVVPVPPITDYPNHLAGCYALAYWQTDPALGQMFSAHWQVIPNIGIDMILPQLMHILSPLTAGRIILALCLLLPTTGTAALGYAYFRQHSFWQIAAGFAAFNGLFLMGFMNFELALGIALWAAAGWIAYRDRFPLLTVFSAAMAGALAFFVHLVGFFFFALLIGSYELSVVWQTDPRTREGRRFLLQRAALLAAALVIPAVLYPISTLEKVDAPVGWLHPFLQKSSDLFVSFRAYSLTLDAVTVGPVLAFFIFCLLARKARVSRAALICCVALFLTYLVVPRALKGVYFVDLRLPVMLGFMIFAGVMPTGLSSRTRSAAVLVLTLLFTARIAFITGVWIESQRDVNDVRQVIASVTPGSRVLAADVLRRDNPAWYASMPISRRLPELTPTYWHLASFVLLDRRAFWPTMFTSEAQEPLHVKEPYRSLRAIESPPPDYRELVSTNIPSTELQRFPFLTDWNHKFDYVLILNAEGASDVDHFAPNRLELIDHRGIAALFKVKSAQ